MNTSKQSVFSGRLQHNLASLTEWAPKKPRLATKIASILALALGASLLSSCDRAPASFLSTPKWEYLILADVNLGWGVKGVTAELLNKAGEEGWECVGMAGDGAVLMKRLK